MKNIFFSQLMQLDIVVSIENHLSLNISIGTDIESAEDDIEVAGRRRHQQEEEVEVRVAEQTLECYFRYITPL